MRGTLVGGITRGLRKASRPRCFSDTSRLKRAVSAVSDHTSSASPSGGENPFITIAKSKVLGREANIRRDAKPARRELLEGPDPLWLRDACSCRLCVDPSSRQKLFQTADIPLQIKSRSETLLSNGSIEITWENDIAGFKRDHVSTYSKSFLDAYRDVDHTNTSRRVGVDQKLRPAVFWNNAVISESVKFIDFEQYMTQDTALFEVLDELRVHGLVFIRGVPPSGTAVEDIGRRIGPLKNSFYGLTWDVKSVAQAKNVAYTNQFLGLHMDLLYVADPPGLQLLHCIKNSCEGGSSMFSDSFYAAYKLKHEQPKLYKSLAEHPTTFHYQNAGENYQRRRRTIVEAPLPGGGQTIEHVNWSPPFQGPFGIDNGILDADDMRDFRDSVEAMKAFAARIEAPENIFEYRLQEGECVIFNNRRTLHARRAFDVSSGERWLKGAYIDSDAFKSRYQVVADTLGTYEATPP